MKRVREIMLEQYKTKLLKGEINYFKLPEYMNYFEFKHMEDSKKIA